VRGSTRGVKGAYSQVEVERNTRKYLVINSS
jgi:hypothetical protein